jgi:hypothetical protein
MAKRKNSGVGAYTNSNSGLTKQDWTERQGEGPGSKDIFKNVNKNSDSAHGGFSGPVKYGTDNE